MEKSKAMAPMTKEEWEKRQSVVRKVLDEESGRYRLSYLSFTINQLNYLFYDSYCMYQDIIITIPQLSLVFRLIKGDGEVLEEIVSRDRHKQINRQATHADGAFFQSQTVEKKML